MRQIAFLAAAVAVLRVPMAHGFEVRQAPELEAVAVTGMLAPGLGDGRVFSGLSLGNTGDGNGAPLINAAGEVALMAYVRLPQPGSQNEGALFSTSGGDLHLVAHAGDRAPGTDGFVFSNLFQFYSHPVLSPLGETSFAAQVERIGAPDEVFRGIWSESEGALALFVVPGQQAPGLPNGVRIANVGSPVVNDLSQMAFQARLEGAGVTPQGNDLAIFSEAGGLHPVVRTGQQAPGTPAGVTFGPFSFEFDSLNGDGKITFLGHLTGAVTEQTNSGIWAEGPAGLRLVARENDRPPGFPPGSFYRIPGGMNPFQTPTMSAAGDVAFGAVALFPSDGRSELATGLWSETGGDGLRLVVRNGQPLPDIGPGVFFDGFDREAGVPHPVMNQAGMLAFGANINGPGVDSDNRDTIWTESIGDLRLRVRAGDHAPGTPPDARFLDFPGSVALNAEGRIAFDAFLRQAFGGVTADNNRGIWAEDVFGELQLVVRTGDLLEAAQNDFRTVSNLAMRAGAGGGNGRGIGFNDLGQIAFWASFTDGSEGVFISNRVLIPEPGTVLLAAIGGGALLAILRWRSVRAIDSQMASIR